MEQSILKSVKQNLGIEVTYTAFDFDVLTYINSAFATLNQLGVGPEGGFQVEDATPVWADFYGSDKRYNSIRTYVFLKVRSIFDPPQTEYAVRAIKEQILELEWRINAYRETTQWTSPDEAPPSGDDTIDGGAP